MIESKRFLPYSGNRYIVNFHGDVTDESGNEFDVIVRDDKKYVVLDWLYGRCEYEVALLVIITYIPTGLPEYMWNMLEPLYKDDNGLNCNLSNLTYRFRNGPLEVPWYSGFYFVPFNTFYAINSSGVLINASNGREMTWWKVKPCQKRNSKGGYSSCRVVTGVNGVSKMLFRHKALCLVFKRYGSNVDNLIVNHIDGNPENDDLNNIEWTTYRDNNQHAYDNNLRPNAAKSVLMKDLKTGVVTTYPSLAACARANGHEFGTYIRLRIKNSSTKLFDDFKAFKFDDGQPWPSIDMSQPICRISGSDIIARNVFTGELLIFSSCISAQDALGIKSGTILNHVKNDLNIPIHGYNFRYYHGVNIDWPKHSWQHLEVYKKQPNKPSNGVIVTNTTSGSETFFTSVRDAAEHYKLSVKFVQNLISNNSVLNGELTFRFFKLRDIWSA